VNWVPAQEECHFPETGLVVHNPQLGSQVYHLQRVAANRTGALRLRGSVANCVFERFGGRTYNRFSLSL
jgi:hypothetical protein